MALSSADKRVAVVNRPGSPWMSGWAPVGVMARPAFQGQSVLTLSSATCYAHESNQIWGNVGIYL